MKLSFEIVPETCWYSNLRKKISKKNWDIIRKGIYAKYNHNCGICGVNDRLNCHEIWDYDDSKYIQYLKGFIALCDMCHHVKHIGFAKILANEGKLDFGIVVDHFCKVNKCSKEDFERLESEAWKVWEERSKHKWVTDFGEYSTLING